ncbi:MAG: catB [Frankiales bacterium]|jgi:L-alanine-DL-glutamate epimerase-like enolase superfamily enzyme|nr:catB [Frankiales bacterium]
MQVSARIDILHLAKTFTISGSSKDDEPVVVVQLECDGLVGVGEGAPVDYWGETPESMLAFLASPEVSKALGDDPFALEDIGDRLAELPGNTGAKMALDGALHDWIGKRLGQPVWRLLGLPPTTPPTSFTIGIDSVGGTIERTREAEGFEVLKIKVGGPDDLARLQAVRANTDARLRIDGNEGWTLDTARELMPVLLDLGVEFVEQPFPAGDIEPYLRLRDLPRRIPVVIDEGCKDSRQVAEIATYADGVNLKLAKTGGIREAVRAVHVARAHGLSVMFGCMIESQLGIAQAAQIASLADYIDLDGHLLISNSPFTGLGFANGRVVVSEEPGLGVQQL